MPELLDIADLKPGYEIAADVENRGGALLLPAGVVLTEESIARLRSAGAELVLVHIRQTKQDLAQNRLQALEARYAMVGDPLHQRLKTIIEKHLNATGSR